MKLRNVTSSAVYVPGIGTIPAGGTVPDVTPETRRSDAEMEDLGRFIDKGLLVQVDGPDAVITAAAEALETLGLRADATAFLSGAWRLVFFSEGARFRRIDEPDPFALGEELETGPPNRPGAIRARIIFVDRDLHDPAGTGRKEPELRSGVAIRGIFSNNSSRAARPLSHFCSVILGQNVLAGWDPGDVVWESLQQPSGWSRVRRGATS